MLRKLGSTPVLLMVMLLSALPVSIARAADWDWSVGGGVGYSDNRSRVPTDAEGETTIDTIFTMDGSQIGTRFDATLAADLTYGVRLDESKGDIRGGGSGAVTYRILPDYLHFYLGDNFGQVRRALDLPDTRDNRSNFNVATAGPDIIIPLGKRSRLDLTGRWSRTDSEISSSNNTRTTTGASLRYGLTTFSALLANASSSRVDFDQLDSSFSYDIQEASLGYRRRTARTTMDVSGGKTRVRFKERELPASTLVRALISHGFTDRTMVTMSAGTVYSDSGDAFVLDQRIYGVDQGTFAGALSTDAFKSDYAILTTELASARVSLSAGLSWNQASHDIQTELDDERRAINATISRRISPRISMRIEGTYGRREIISLHDTFTDHSEGLGFTWLYNPAFSIEFDVVHQQGVRAGMSVATTQYDYKENYASLRFLYSPVRR